MTHVKLVYFRERGKYYSEGELDLPAEHDERPMMFHEVVHHIRQLLERGERPGLVDGHDFHTHITVYTEHGPLCWLFARRPDGSLW